MPPKHDIIDAGTRRLSAEEKKRLAREKRDARLAAEGRTLGEGIASAHGILAGAEGEEFERAFWAARRAGMAIKEAPMLD